VNAKSVRLTGRKLLRKEYVRHSGYAGGLRTDSAQDMLATHPDRVVRQAGPDPPDSQPRLTPPARSDIPCPRPS